jgi:hypothetical protein
VKTFSMPFAEWTYANHDRAPLFHSATPQISDRFNRRQIRNSVLKGLFQEEGRERALRIISNSQMCSFADTI